MDTSTTLALPIQASSVSIVTVTQLIRFECILVLYELIKLQTYENIVEWVIVEGSQHETDGLQNNTNIQRMIENHSLNFKIIYINYTGQKLSDLRNLGNESCIGDIIVCMDDDDYYPPSRVQHAVETLEQSSCLLAGCTDIYLYEYRLKKMYKCYGFHSYHSTNNVMAYKREYLIHHKYESGLSMAEEAGFTNNFTEPMEQLSAKKSIIVSSHSNNTFDKLHLCLQKYTCFYEIDEDITTFIPKEIFSRMCHHFEKRIDKAYAKHEVLQPRNEVMPPLRSRHPYQTLPTYGCTGLRLVLSSDDVCK